MSDLRRGCIGAIVVSCLFILIGEHPANHILRSLQVLIMMFLGFVIAVAMFGRWDA